MAKKQRKTSVLVATGLYPPDIGGPATYSKLLEEELPKHDMDVKVFSFGSVRKLPVGVRHIVYFLLLLIKGIRADIIYALDPVSVGFPSLLASNVLSKKLFLRLGGDYAWEMASLKHGVVDPPHIFVNNSGTSLNIKVLKYIQNLVANQADRIIVPSKYLKKVVLKWGVDADKIVVINSTFDDVENVADKSLLRQMMNIESDETVALSAGRLIPLKSLDLVIKSIPNIIKKYPKFKYIIAGDGPEYKKLSKLIKNLSLEKHVVLTGRLDKATLVSYIKISDVFILNSLHETFPHVLLEAMSLGVPVIACNVGGNPEIIDHEKDGILIEHGNVPTIEKEIKRVLGEEVFRNKLINGAFIKLKKFNKDNSIKLILKELKH